MRYTIWTMQSGWHNLPIVNGVEQKEGGEFRSSSFITDDRNCLVGIDHAYPETAGIKSWNRSFNVLDETVCLTDSWEMKAEENTITWNFLCLAEPTLSEGFVTIPLAEGKVVISFPKDLLKGSLDFQEVPEGDTKMRVWGRDRIWRIKLETTNPLTSVGNILFKIKGE